MARPERNNVDYFPHPVKHGKKMHYLENKYGNDGYATWFKLLEELGDANYHYLNLNKEEQVMYLSSRCLISEIKLFEIINDLVKFGEFDEKFWDKKILVDEKFINSIQDAYKKRNNKCLSLISLSKKLSIKSIPKQSNGNLKSGEKPQRIGKDTIEDQTIGKEIKEKKIINEKKIDELHSLLKKIFIEFYYQKKELEYYWTGKDAGQLTELIKKLKYYCKETEKLPEIFQFMLEKNNIKWVNENLSIAILNSKFNDIVANIKGSQSMESQIDKFIDKKYE